MGRLIDADKLLETLQDLEPHCENKDYEYGMLNTMRYYMPKIINDEPIAYNVDKVVEQLETMRMRYYLTYANTGNKTNDEVWEKVNRAVDNAIEIVKGGGVK